MRYFAAFIICIFSAEATTFLKAVDAAMRDEMKRQDLVGLAVGVIFDGRVAYMHG